jgi:serine/threonine-protein kinase
MGLEDVGYHVLGPIARGGMAEVVLAERIGVGGVRKRLAIKRLLPELANDPEFVTMLENEARIAVELDHPNVVSVFELGEADGELFLAMEFVRGWDASGLLDACAKRDIDIPIPIALFVVREVCRALEYAHEKKNDHGQPFGIVHRDVTPSNVLLSVDGTVKLADFGIARAAAIARTTGSGSRRGKVPYLSPEQVDGKSLDARTDLYSLGLVLFALVTGRPLFSDDATSAARERLKPIPRLSSLREEARALQPLFDRVLAPDRTARHASARALGEELDRAIDAHRPAANAGVLRAFIESLSLPAPVGPANVADGERTVRLALDADGVRAVAPEITTDPLPTNASPAASASAPPEERTTTKTTTPASKTPTAAMGAALVLAFVTSALIARCHAVDDGSIEVRTTPPGATVWIDGAARGTTPLTIGGLPRRTIILKVGRDDKHADEHSVDLGATADQVLDVDVRPLP